MLHDSTDQLWALKVTEESALPLQCHMLCVLRSNINTSPVESSALEVDGGQEQQHTCVIRLLPPQLHAVTLSCLKVPRLILPVRQLGQPLEGKHTFCRFWITNTAQEGGKQHVRVDGRN